MDHSTTPDDDDGDGESNGTGVRGPSEEDDDGEGHKQIHDRQNIPPGPEDPDPPCED